MDVALQPIPILSVLSTSVTLLISVFLPLALWIVLQVKTKKAIMPVLLGAGAFVLFVAVLESLVHGLVFTALPNLQQNALLYVVYACLAAGVFEETGRLVVLAWLCRKKDSTLATGLSYGVGHGGIEAVLITGIGAFNTLANMLLVNTGGAQAALAQMEAPQAQMALQSLDTLATTPPSLFLIGGFERLSAIALHIALSVVIWMVVTKRLPKYFYALCILLHALANVGAALYQTGVVSLVAAEAWGFVVSAGVCVLAYVLYRKSRPSSAVPLS